MTMTIMMEIILSLSILSILALPITAIPELSHLYLAPRNDFDPGYPANPEPEPASQHPVTSYNLSVLPPSLTYKPTNPVLGYNCRRRRHTDMCHRLSLLYLPTKTKNDPLTTNSPLPSRRRNLRNLASPRSRRPRKTNSSSMACRTRSKRCPRVYL